MLDIDRELRDMQRLYPDTPEHCARKLSQAARSVKEEGSMRKSVHFTRALAVALVLLCLSAAALAAYSPKILSLYDTRTRSWLAQGNLAQPDASLDTPYAVFTLTEVVQRNGGLYGLGMITPKEGTLLLPWDSAASDPYGYDVHHGEKAPDGTPTTAQQAAASGSVIRYVEVTINRIGVDGGTMLAPPVHGGDLFPQQDGSILFLVEVEDGTVVTAGETYTLSLSVDIYEADAEGTILPASLCTTDWTMEIRPKPISENSMLPTAAPTATASAAAAPTEPQIIVPEAYAQTGTLSVCQATERDFTRTVQPETFNRSGIARQEEGLITFLDGAELQIAPEALFYGEYDGTYEAVSELEDGSSFTETLPRPTMASAAADLAGWMASGFPGTGETYGLESAALTRITLEEARARLEALLAEAGMEGYVCDTAIDMSVARIQAMGAQLNAAIDSGALHTNGYRFDYTQATAGDEGFLLVYHKYGADSDFAREHAASAYVTADGFASISLRDRYVPGETIATPERLVDAQTVLEALPGAMAASRYPETLASVTRVRLTWQPACAEDGNGMVLVPAWSIVYQTEASLRQGYDCWAVFSAVDGGLMDAVFQ